jgi:hypothetical protein
MIDLLKFSIQQKNILKKIEYFAFSLYFYVIRKKEKANNANNHQHTDDVYPLF